MKAELGETLKKAEELFNQGYVPSSKENEIYNWIRGGETKKVSREIYIALEFIQNLRKQ